NQEQLTRRLGESRFKWFSSNVTNTSGQPLPNVPVNVVLTARNDNGKEVRVGLFGLTVDSNRATYLSYRDPLAVATEQVTALRDEVDVLVAVTHLNLDGDIRLARRRPGSIRSLAATNTRTPRCGGARTSLRCSRPTPTPGPCTSTSCATTPPRGSVG
ncbi:MAG TPA: hypothetical protein VHF00_00850, partial [Acidimicrobiales bacterium]|nr:hypothetical protein [Acidimicrobiales bacterium]